MLLKLDRLQAPVDEQLRLLHVVPTYLPAVRYGGPIRSVHALCRELAALGHDVHVFTTSVDGPGDSDVPLGTPVELEGVQVSYYPSRVLRRLYWSPPMRRALAENVRRFDLVHLHAVFLWPTWAGARAARAARIPYVVSPRGMLVPELIRRKSRWVKSAWIAMIDRRNVERAAAVHATSNVEARHLESFGWALPPIAVVPHGVDDPQSTSSLVSSDVAAAISAGPIVLAFGRINWEKGLDRLIAATAHAAFARVVIAGDDEEGFARVLQAEAQRLGVSQRVVILARHIDGADKEALFRAAALFSMTSLSENFGLAAFEAMRRGLPVLATPDVGMSEIVRSIGAGLVVEPTAHGIAAGLTRLLSDPVGARKMGVIGREHVIANYGWPAVARRMEGLYCSIVGAGTAAQSGK